MTIQGFHWWSRKTLDSHRKWDAVALNQINQINQTYFQIITFLQDSEGLEKLSFKFEAIPGLSTVCMNRTKKTVSLFCDIV